MTAARGMLRLREAAVSVGSAVAIASALCLPAHATCGNLDPPAVSVEVTAADSGTPRIAAASGAEIRERALATGAHAPVDAVTTGLTLAETATRASFTLSTVTRSDGSRCNALKELVGEVTDDGITVLIDRTYQPGSCPYEAVLAHEWQHVRINSDANRRIGQLLEERLVGLAKQWGGTWLTQVDRRTVERELEVAIAATTRLAREEADRRHHWIDTPAAYAEVQGRCNDW